MPPTPHIEPLPQHHRRIIFILSLLLFFITVPLLVFYAIGYRLDFSGDNQNFRTVGGMYISAESEQAEIFLDEQAVENVRIFQRAAYVQNVTAGQHRIHTQGEGIQTWVKELPVFSHLVTEASSFNMPKVSTVRYIAPFVNEANQPLYASSLRDSRPFLSATSSQLVVYSTTSPALVGSENPEYAFVETLFASTTADRNLFLKQQSYNPEKFTFTPPLIFTTTTASTTRVVGESRLQMKDEELYASWIGDMNDVPYYFCVFAGSYASTSQRYGAHIAEQLYIENGVVPKLASTTVMINNKFCRSEVRIDRKWQSVIWFEFLPNTTDLVLMQLQDGVYVAEIDDRAWQNVQPLYLGDYLTMVVNNDQILIRDGDIYFEILTEPLATN